MITFRKIEKDDRAAYLQMAHDFYHSDAVLHPIPDQFIEATFEEMMQSQHYAIGVMLLLDEQIVGYALLAKTFSQEAGGYVLWVEELYVKEDFRGNGVGKAFLSALIDHLPQDVTRVRLETERENHRAVKLYESLGFGFLGYDQMIYGQ